MDAMKEQYLEKAEQLIAAPGITIEQRREVLAAVAYAKDGEELRRMLISIARRATGRST